MERGELPILGAQGERVHLDARKRPYVFGQQDVARLGLEGVHLGVEKIEARYTLDIPILAPMSITVRAVCGSSPAARGIAYSLFLPCFSRML